MKVLVVSGLGDRPAQNEIVDVLLTTEAVCRERGRNYLIANGADKKMFALEHRYRVMPLPCALAEVHDSELGESFRGRLVGWRMSVSKRDQDSPVEISIESSVEREL